MLHSHGVTPAFLGLLRELGQQIRLQRLAISPAMDNSSKQDGTSLSNLIHELSDFLQAQSEESTTTTPHSGSSAVAPRMRTVLLALLNECLEFRIGQDRKLHPVI